VSRYLVITLAAVAAGVKFTQGAWVEAAGLSGLAIGLTAMKLGRGSTAAKYVAVASLGVTALAVAALAIRRWAS
jgi:hypothetical protein